VSLFSGIRSILFDLDSPYCPSFQNTHYQNIWHCSFEGTQAGDGLIPLVLYAYAITVLYGNEGYRVFILLCNIAAEWTMMTEELLIRLHVPS